MSEKKCVLLSYKKLDEETSIKRASLIDTPKGYLAKSKPTFHWLFCIIFASIGTTFQFGYQIGIFNAPFIVIKKFYEETYLERYNSTMSGETFTIMWSVTNGLMPLGGMLGAIVSGTVANYCGRKGGIMLTNILVIIVGGLNISAKFIQSFEILIVGKFIAGIYCGLFTGILPLYLMEITEPVYRGFAGSMIGISIGFGIFVSNLVALPEIFGTDDLWFILAGFVLVPALFNLGMVFASESPKYLYVNRKSALQAKKCLNNLRGSKNQALIENELSSYENEKIALEMKSTINWKNFFLDSSLRRPLVVAVVINMSQQLSGINAVSFYSAIIFGQAGLEDSWPIYATILVSFVQFLMSFVCMAFIDRLGRRSLLLISLIGMGASSFGLPVFDIISNNNPDKPFLSYFIVFFVVTFIIFFGAGSGSIANLITVELFDSNESGKANSIACSVNWFSNFCVVLLFPILQERIGTHVFFIFGGFLLLFIIFTYFFLPETKGKTIEEIKMFFEATEFKNQNNSLDNVDKLHKIIL